MPLESTLKKYFYKFSHPGSKPVRLIYRVFRGFQLCFNPINVQYRKWIKQNDSIDQKTLRELHHAVEMMKDPPLFSVIMPVYNPSPKLLDEAIQSIRDQYYPRWDLCIADDASTLPGVREVIEKHAREDDRIKVVFREENGHISAASNSALDLANGDFVAFLDHDDLLHPLALYLAAKTIEEFPDSELIYFDEDKITESGIRFKPYFKPDFDYELVLSQNMVSHCGIYKIGAVRQIGGFRVGLEGSQDHDLLLRVLEQIKPPNIHHIPSILYHWRTSENSAAENINLKPYAIKAGERAITEHLTHRGVPSQVEYDFEVNAYKIEYEIEEPFPLVEIVLISEKGALNIQSIKALLSNAKYPNLRLTLGVPSEEDQINYSEELDDPRISFRKNNPSAKGSQLFNQIVEASDAAYICVIDESVVEFTEGWLQELMRQATQKGIGVVEPKLLASNNLVFSNGMILGGGNFAEHLFAGQSADGLGYFSWGQIVRGYTALSNECLLFRKADFLEAGGLTTALANEQYIWMDFCLKLRDRGLRNVLCPSIRLKLSKRVNENVSKEVGREEKYLLERWEKWFSPDPAINPNLVIKKGKIRLSLEPRV
jgi:glycosyltransferase involved in cell wall biosynthesis